MALSAGHGHGVVEQHLVSGVHLGGHRRADSQQARVEIGAVADVDEHMLLGGEMRRPRPGDALGAHVGEGGSFTVHPLHHVMAADASQRARTFRHLGRCVVRATGAKVRRAHCHRDRLGDGTFARVQERDARLQFGAQIGRGQRQQAADHRAGDQRRREFAMLGQERAAGRVELAGHARRAGHAVEDFLHLRFDQRTLFLDGEHLGQAGGKFAHTGFLQRPGHGDLEQAQAQVGRHFLVDAQVGQRLAQVGIGLAGGGQAQGGLDAGGLAPQHAVQLVGADIGLDRRQLVVEQARFLAQEIDEVEADRKPAFGHGEIGRDHRGDA